MLKVKIIDVGMSYRTSARIIMEAPGRHPHPCIYYRKFNEITGAEYIFFVLLNIEERVEKIAAAKFITVKI